MLRVGFAPRRVVGVRTVHGFPPAPPPPARRVVVTGRGLVSPLGCGVDPSWDSLVAGGSGLVAASGVEGLDAEGLPAQVVAAVPNAPCDDGRVPFDASQWVDRKDTRTQSARFIAFALAAAGEALQESRVLEAVSFNGDRAGVAIGSGIGCIADIEETALTLAGSGYRRMSPFFVPRILVNMAAGHVSIKHGLRGPNHAVSTACATGAHAIGDAFRLIRNGDADVMVAGGTEASINRITLAGFSKSRALSTNFNDTPTEASRPFDAQRDGFVLGEGAACLVLEDFEHALARGAPILAEVRGYGLSGDAHHITVPSGSGAQRAMASAMAEGGLSPGDVGYVNAHATSTPLGDEAELGAIQTVFKAHSVAVSSTKGAVGHLLGAAGAAEALFAVNTLIHGTIPPTRNLTDFDGGQWPAVDVVGDTSRSADLRAVMSNSFGFGGTNCSLLFCAPPS